MGVWTIEPSEPRTRASVPPSTQVPYHASATAAASVPASSRGTAMPVVACRSPSPRSARESPPQPEAGGATLGASSVRHACRTPTRARAPSRGPSEEPALPPGAAAGANGGDAQLRGLLRGIAHERVLPDLLREIDELRAENERVRFESSMAFHWPSTDLPLAFH